MRLDPGIAIDLDDRVRKSIAGLPPRIRLEGNAMQQGIAARLLAAHAPHTTVAEDGEPVLLCSLEAYGAAQLAAFIDGKPLPSGRRLLHTLPEAMLIAYAERHGIPVVREARDDVRALIGEIADAQTHFSLARGMERLANPPGKGA